MTMPEEPYPSSVAAWRPLARLAATERRVALWAAEKPGRLIVYEFLRFGLKQAWACLFGAIMLALLFGTRLYYPPCAQLARYDFLVLAAFAVQALMLMGRLETWEEAKVIFLFHIVGTAMEAFKVSTGSWAYPEASLLRIAGVPLFTGFMYASVGSFIARTSRLFDLRYSRHPPIWQVHALAAAIYANFFLDHYGHDIRLLLFAAACAIFWPTWISFRVWRRRRRMPLLLANFLTAAFLWIAENVGTFAHAWVYPAQVAGWRPVGFGKLSSWYLLLIISYALVAIVSPPRPPDRNPDRAPSSPARILQRKLPRRISQGNAPLKRLALALVALVLIAAVAAWVVSAPRDVGWETAEAVSAPGDAAAGRIVFFESGCESCHQSPGQDDPLKLGGGAPIVTAFGSFYPSNISPDLTDGIGAWSAVDFANAILAGVSPKGQHLYPALPYPSYRLMKPKDVSDLFAFLKTLPPVQGAAPKTKLAFPFSLRRGVGFWKLLYLGAPPPPREGMSPSWLLGRYLVEGPGHCAECHSPRDAFGGVAWSQRLEGGLLPDGKGKTPALTPEGLKDWSREDIAEALSSGFTPSGDTLGGPMAAVVRNTAQLPASYRAAIADYLKTGRGL